jgi:hypothetical protein
MSTMTKQLNNSVYIILVKNIYYFILYPCSQEYNVNSFTIYIFHKHKQAVFILDFPILFFMQFFKFESIRNLDLIKKSLRHSFVTGNWYRYMTILYG